MSIAPVQSFPPERNEPSEPGSAQTGQTQAKNALKPAGPSVQPVSGTLPKQKTAAEKVVPPTYGLPQDVVELHQDPEIKDQVIVEYLDKAKNQILQVPSNQELGVQRGIAEDFEEAAKLRENSAAAARQQP